MAYTICAYVIVPHSMSHRHSLPGSFEFVLPREDLAADSVQEITPLFYLFDTPDAQAESAAESYLAARTANDPELMYESKATLRADFAGFQRMFLLLGGLLCGIIGVVGILNFLNAIMTGILSRQREFAVLQSVGMTTAQLKAMLRYEGLFYALGSAGLALLLSLALNPLLGRLLEKLFWFFRSGFVIAPVLLSVPVFALLGLCIPTVMYGQSVRQTIVERLREAG